MSHVWLNLTPVNPESGESLGKNTTYIDNVRGVTFTPHTHGTMITECATQGSAEHSQVVSESMDVVEEKFARVQNSSLEIPQGPSMF